MFIYYYVYCYTVKISVYQPQSCPVAVMFCSYFRNFKKIILHNEKNIQEKYNSFQYSLLFQEI